MREIIAQEKAVEREKARIEKGKRDGEKFVNTSKWTGAILYAVASEGRREVKTDGSQKDFFHIYQDRLHFPHQADITRDDEEKGEHGQRYTLCVSATR